MNGIVSFVTKRVIYFIEQPSYCAERLLIVCQIENRPIDIGGLSLPGPAVTLQSLIVEGDDRYDCEQRRSMPQDRHKHSNSSIVKAG
jgi:hypothetical protein